MISHNETAIVFIIFASLGLLTVAAVLFLAEAKDEDIARRVRAVVRGGEETQRTGLPVFGVLLRIVGRVGDSLRDTALMSPSEIAQLQRMLGSAGFNPRSALSAVLGTKVLLPPVLAVAAYAVGVSQGWPTMRVIMIAGAALPAGMMLPNLVMGKLQKRYRKTLERGIPDALDLIVICAEAGLGLETAIERVAIESRMTNRAVATEFSLLDQEMRLLSDRARALTNFGERAALDVMKRLAASVIQTIEYGTPLSKGLRILAAELRQERLVRLEEQAARLPALLVMPLILFILPCLFIVLLGPSIITLSATLGGSK